MNKYDAGKETLWNRNTGRYLQWTFGLLVPVLLVAEALVIILVARQTDKRTDDVFCIGPGTCGEMADMLHVYLNTTINEGFDQLQQDEEHRREEETKTKTYIALKSHLQTSYWQMIPAARVVGDPSKQGDEICGEHILCSAHGGLQSILYWTHGGRVRDNGVFLRHGMKYRDGRLVVPVTGTYYIYSYLAIHQPGNKGTHNAGRRSVTSTHNTGRRSVTSTHNTGRRSVTSTNNAERRSVPLTHKTDLETTKSTHNSGQTSVSDTHNAGLEQVEDTHNIDIPPVTTTHNIEGVKVKSNSKKAHMPATTTHNNRGIHITGTNDMGNVYPSIKHAIYRFNIIEGKEEELLVTSHWHQDTVRSDYNVYNSRLDSVVRLKAGDELSVKTTNVSYLIYPGSNYFGVNMI